MVFFFQYSYLVLEGRAGQPKMMSVGLHCRLSRPARASAIAEFVDYAKSYGREVWITTREQIANHWYENHLPRGCGSPILSMSGHAQQSANDFPQKPTRSKSGDSNASFGSPIPQPTAPSSKFSFLGNLKAPRDSEEYKQSLKSSSTLKSEDVAEEEELDVI